MKLAYVDLCGFRGYRKPIRVEFADSFTVIDGRNGVGKSTICDAVEFALTGTIAKYADAKADGETVADYIWWSGEGPKPDAHYVEVGFTDDDAPISIRREQFREYNQAEISTVLDRLTDAVMRPQDPLPQLCTASIIRDEHIAALSLDLSETKRYALLCDAIGATDADEWVERGREILALARRRTATAESEARETEQAILSAGRRIDEARAAIAEEAAVASALVRLQAFAGTTASVDQIAEVGRVTIAAKTRQLEQLVGLRSEWPQQDVLVAHLGPLREKLEAAKAKEAEVDQALQQHLADVPVRPSGEIAQRAKAITDLVALGRKLGLAHGHCPLCWTSQEQDSFIRGLQSAEAEARDLDSQAVEVAKREAEVATAREHLDEARRQVIALQQEADAVEGALKSFRERLVAAGIPEQGRAESLSPLIEEQKLALETASRDLAIIETLKNNTALDRAQREQNIAKQTFARAQQRLSVARLAENRAQALYDAARRAAGETLTQRLDRVLPLMAELFRRLRPHPLWGDIEYKIRGDVRRFLKLQVGDELNPQFIFSSGQRRATGLAFLLSVNLSLAWSRWQTILLDDPVQHVDDFRSIHLAEVLAQLVSAGRQIVCVVEDAALADLLCRRLPVDGVASGKRVTLGPDRDGALAVLEERGLAPLTMGSLVTHFSKVAS